MNSFLLLGVYTCVRFGETDFIICPMLHAKAMGQTTRGTQLLSGTGDIGNWCV